MSLISIEDAIKEIRDGRMVILVDDEDRERSRTYLPLHDPREDRCSESSPDG